MEQIAAVLLIVCLAGLGALILDLNIRLDKLNERVKDLEN